MSEEREVKECRQLTIDAVRIVNVSKGLSRGWDRIPSEGREEFLGNLKDYAHDLRENNQISADDYNNYVFTVDMLSGYNKGENTVNVVSEIYEKALDLAINAIHNCVEKTK
ncbi:MAG: hypothetical protein M0Q12_00900 [Synergistaceae bacterium]|jgi:hypothetical protein|nr:hypothetical protein [Synergistaceae bacterium]